MYINVVIMDKLKELVMKKNSCQDVSDKKLPRSGGGEEFRSLDRTDPLGFLL